MKQIWWNVDRSYITCLSTRSTFHQRLLSTNAVSATSAVMLFASGGVVARTFRQVSQLLKVRPEELPCFTLEEVGCHDNYDDCWIILFDKIYNVTDFVHLHPGGEMVILEHAGRDATFTFLSAGHAEHMMAILSRYLVGRLPSCEQIFQAEESNPE